MAQSRRSSSSATKGVSLARGPALLIGTVLLAAGLYFLYRAHTFPALSRFGSGHARIDDRAFFHVFGVNGWSAELTAVAGGVLLFCAAQHILAKTASLIVAIVLAGVAIIALFDHHSALGLFAAGIWTMVLWGGAALLLLINALLPRTAGSPATAAAEPLAPAPAPLAARTPVSAAPVAPRPAAVAPTAPARVEPVTTQMPAEPVTTQMPAEPVTTRMPAEPVTTQMPAEPVPTQMPAEPVTTQMPAEPVTTRVEPEPATAQLEAEPTTEAVPTQMTSSDSGTSTHAGGSPAMGPIRTEPVTGSSSRPSNPDSE